jgi:hypothetical protein
MEPAPYGKNIACMYEPKYGIRVSGSGFRVPGFG